MCNHHERHSIEEALVSGVQGQGKGILVDNGIFANSNCGVKIIDGGNPTLRRNHIHNNSEMGIFIDEGLGTLEENDVSANGREGEWRTGGVMINKGVGSTLENNSTYDNAGFGVIVSKNSRRTLEGNDISANGKFGVFISEGGAPMLQNNRIDRHGHCAVAIIDRGGGTFYDNDLSHNAQAWSISRNSKQNVKRGRNKEHPGL